MLDTIDYDYSFRLEEPVEGDEYITFDVPVEGHVWQVSPNV